MANRITIKRLTAREILDSRGQPTIACTLTVSSGQSYTASVPAGASVGQDEAKELRDNDLSRYGGKGVLSAVNIINQEFSSLLQGHFLSLEKIDSILINHDGTQDKHRYGANTLLAISYAVARAQAAVEGKPLYKFIAEYTGSRIAIPCPLFNLINGGRHVSGAHGIQEYMLFPLKSIFQEQAGALAKTLPEVFAITELLKKQLLKHQEVLGIGDEGGFVSGVTNKDSGAHDIFAFFNQTLAELGLKNNYAYALDAAAEQFYSPEIGHYILGGRHYTPEELALFYQNLSRAYPIRLLEDPFIPQDQISWKFLNQELNQTIVVGDDLTVSHAALIKQKVSQGLVGGVIIKPNQVGTVTEAFAAVEQAREMGIAVIVSHRSGETCDDFIADFAVGVGAGYVKFGACQRSERVAKYNRLLAIEQELSADSEMIL